MKNGISNYLRQLESESIHIIREVAAEFANPVMLYSVGKDSSVMLHLAMKAFYPAKPPFPLLHIDTTWKFREMIAFRDRVAASLGLDLLVHTNEEGRADGISPIAHGSALYTDIMKTQALKQALTAHGFDAAFGGARRDEEKSRAKERVFSFRNENHGWNPKNQRPELWRVYNTRVRKGESIRVFPLSNWTELDIWTYIHLEEIPIVPLYLAADRPVVERDGMLIMAAGVAFALLAAAGWAAYILLSAATGSRFAGSSGLAIASVVGTALILPIGVRTGGADLLRPEVLLLGIGIGLLSSVIPYSFELEALRRMPAQLFGILMSVEPAAAALVGLVVIGEVLQLREWAAIGLVVIACLGATRSQQEPREAPEV